MPRLVSTDSLLWQRFLRPTIVTMVLAAVGLAYWPGLHAPFVFDDIPAILENPSIRQWWPISGVLSPPHEEGSTVGGRPVVNLSLALNWSVSGSAPWSYHALNVLIHLLAAATSFGLVRRTLRRWPGRHARLQPDAVAGIIATLWLLHPLQTESVTYVVQRAESLAGLFCLLTLYGFIRAQDGGRTGRFWRLACVTSCFAGMATKESMVVAPLLVLLYDRAFVAGSFRAAWREHAQLYLMLASSWLLLAWLVAGTEGRGGTAGFGTEIGPWAYLLTQTRAITTYLRLAFWPHPLVFDYGMVSASGLGDVAWEAVSVTSLLVAALWALIRRPAWGFWAVWFFLALAPSSSFVPVASQTIAEHRMYVPLLPLLTLLVVAVGPRAGRWGVALACVAIGASAIGTYSRNQIYRTEISLWTDTAQHQPTNARALNNLAAAWLAQHQPDKAETAAREAVRLSPAYADAWNNLGLALANQGRTAEAWTCYERSLAAAPNRPEVWNNAGIALAATGRFDEAIASYQRALSFRPGYAEAENNLGNALAKAGRERDALSHYETALRLQPDYFEARVNLGRSLAALGDTERAIRELQAALQLRDDAHGHVALGHALLLAGRTEAAASAYQQALRLAPTESEAAYNLGNLQLAAGRLDAAIASYRASLEGSSAQPGAHHNLALALTRAGRPAEALTHFEATLRLLPDSAITHHNLALALADLGRFSEAIAHEEAALRLQPDLADARQHLRALRRRSTIP
jgi:tetratricopeptide (TPR) repeat protein